MKDKITVRTTMRPDEDLEVDEAEALDLERSGLIEKSNSPEPELRDLSTERRRLSTTEDKP